MWVLPRFGGLILLGLSVGLVGCPQRLVLSGLGGELTQFPISLVKN